MPRADSTSVQRGPRFGNASPSRHPSSDSRRIPGADFRCQVLQPDEQPTSIKGTVVNAITHAPIARALVYSPDNRLAALTDGEGNFSFALPKPGSNAGNGFNGGLLGLTARKPGFLNDPNDRRQAETSGSELTITIPLMPEALIKGRVISSETDPTPGINVQLFSRQVQDGMPKWVQTGSTRANSSGEFRFAELLPGTYKLLSNEWMDNDPATTIPGGQQFGYPSCLLPWRLGFRRGRHNSTHSRTNRPGGSSTDSPALLSRKNSGREPQTSNGGMNITVSVQGHRGPGYSLGYNAQNQRIEGLLPNGNYLVEAATYGQNSVSGSAHLAVAGAPAEGSSMTLIPNSSITVHVTEEFTSTNSEESSVGFHTIGGRTFRCTGPGPISRSMPSLRMISNGRAHGFVRQPVRPMSLSFSTT